MKPKDLHYPHSWENRKPTFHQGVFFLPKYYGDYSFFTFPQWSDALCFGNSHPVHIEFCSGNGSWIAERAQRFPEINWVAVEMRFDRTRKIWAKKQNLDLQNLLIVCGEAQTFTTHYVQSSSVEQTYVNFPDPWPKDRHAKHRLIQGLFVEELSRILMPEGKAIVVTDDLPLSEQVQREMMQKELFSTLSNPSDFADYGTSFFEELWRQKGRSIHYLQYLNQKAALQCSV